MYTKTSNFFSLISMSTIIYFIRPMCTIILSLFKNFVLELEGRPIQIYLIISVFFCKNIGNIATTKCVMIKNYLRIKKKLTYILSKILFL